MKRDPVPPTVDVPLDVALEELAGYEVLLLEKHFNAPLEQLGAAKTLLAVVWAYENRDGKQRSWRDVEKMSLRQLNGYFAEPSVEPDDETGKG